MEALAAALARSPDPVLLWWRDDDAGSAHPHLGRLLQLSCELAIPLHLAVVPAWLTPEAERLITATAAHVDVLQHGWAHEDHGRPGEKKIELGGRVATAAMRDRLGAGRDRLHSAFASRFRTVLVPPWNRMEDRFLPLLSDLGFSGLSTLGRDARGGAFGLVQRNVTLDPIVWREGRRFLDEDELAAALIEAIEEGRGGPIGLLTHHLAMGDTGFTVLAALLSRLSREPRVRWLDAVELFPEPS